VVIQGHVNYPKAFTQDTKCSGRNHRRTDKQRVLTTLRWVGHKNKCLLTGAFLPKYVATLCSYHGVLPQEWIGLCSVQCFTSPPTQYRLYGRRILQVKRPNQQYQSTEGESCKGNRPTHA